MPRVRWTPAARRHLDEIFDYVAIEKSNPTAAARLLRLLSERARFFARNPSAGHPRSELAEEVRCFVVGSYVGVYRPAADGIEILMVAHGARDLPRLFRKSARDEEE